MQILILGMHRSGTSLVTRMVNMMGAYAGPEGSMLGFTVDNPKGYWERKDVIQHNVALLKLHDATWPNITHWPVPFHPVPLPPPLREAMKTLILNMDAHRPWVMKDPRLCITLPYWKPLLEVPVCVIVYRNPLETAESLHKRKNDSVPFKQGIALWEFYAVSLLNASRDLPRIFVIHSDFLDDPVATTAQLYHGLTAQGVQGLRLPSAREINAFIDKKLYRSKPKAQALTARQQELIAMLQGEPVPEGWLAVSEESKAVLQQPV